MCCSFVSSRNRLAMCALLASLVVVFLCACENESTCPTAPAGRTVFYGNLIIDSQTGVDALAGIETWVGDLRISGSNINNLRGLGSLRRVRGELFLYLPDIDNLNPLGGLREVERFSLGDGGRVTSLAPLSQIEDCIFVSIANCDSLDHLPDGSLFASARNISISDLPRLASLEPLSTAVATIDLNLRNLPAISGFERACASDSTFKLIQNCIETIQVFCFSHELT